MPMYTDNSPAYGRLYGSAFEGVKQYCGGESANVRYALLAFCAGRLVRLATIGLL